MPISSEVDPGHKRLRTVVEGSVSVAELSDHLQSLIHRGTIRKDYRAAPIDERDRAMLDDVARMTRDATRITLADHERLRAAGFDDRGIFRITLIAAWFNDINRVADALGVGREP